MSDRQSSDPIFQQLSSAADLLGLFSMTTEGEVIESLGEFQDQSAELHAPVILHILLDAKGVLDSAPFSRASRGTEPMKRIVLTYKSFTLSIVYVVDRVYVIKAMNLEDNEGEGEMQQQME